MDIRTILDARRDSCPTCQNLPTMGKTMKRSDSVQTDILINTLKYATKKSPANQWLVKSPAQRSDSVSHRYCFPCLAKYRKPNDDAAPIQLKLCYLFSCPPHGKMAFWLTLALQALLLWGTLWSVLGADLLPGGNVFNIVVLFVVCGFLGLLVESLGLPRLLGVLLGGIILGNVPHIDVAKHIDRDWSFAIRKIAVVVVLIRAGIGSDPGALVRRKWMILRLTLFPALVEGVIVAVTTHYLLHFPWLWSFIHGFVLAPMSAAAAIPFMLQFQQAGYGVTKGIPTAIKFGACFDNVLALSIFSVLLDVAFDKDKSNLAYIILMKGPVQLLLGLVAGVVSGLILWYLPHRNSKRKVLYRTTFLFGLCMFAAFATGTVSFSSAGPLGVISMALVARLKWRFQGWTGVNDPIPPIFAHIWKICQIMLAGLIGALLDLRDLDWKVVGLVVAVIIIGLSFRLLTTFLVVQCTDLNVRERLFVMISWIPKATVQAAIGSMALDRAHRSNSSPEEVRRGEIILMSAVFAILLTAPLGAILIANTGKRLLSLAQHHDHTTETRRRDIEKGLDNMVFETDEPATDSLADSTPRGSISDDSPTTHRTCSNSDSNCDTGIDSGSTSNDSTGAEDSKPRAIFQIADQSLDTVIAPITIENEVFETTNI